MVLQLDRTIRLQKKHPGILHEMLLYLARFHPNNARVFVALFLYLLFRMNTLKFHLQESNIDYIRKVQLADNIKSSIFKHERTPFAHLESDL